VIPAVVRVPAYRRFIASAMSTNAGLWMFETALFWLVLKQTGSSTAVGLVLTALLGPLILFALPGGVLTDRFGPHRLMMISCVGWTLLVTTMAFLATSGPVTFPIALAAALLVGCFDSIWTIPGQVLVARVVEPHHMANAIALSPLQFGIGRIVGGLAGGALVAAAGPPITFLVAAGFLLAGVVAMATVREVQPHRVKPGQTVGVGEGLSWILKTPAAIALVVLGACTAVFAYSYLAVLPAVSRDLLHAGPDGLGMMTAAGGAGVILVALAGNAVGIRLGRGKVVPASLLIAACGLLLLAFSTSVVLSVALVGVVASMLILYTITNNLVLQSLTPRSLRGRVLAIWGVAYFVSLPVGSVTAGNLADRFGTRTVLICLAALTATATAAVVAGYRPLLGLDVGPAGEPLVSGLIVSQPPVEVAGVRD
jgi:MFS family permease